MTRGPVLRFHRLLGAVHLCRPSPESRGAPVPVAACLRRRSPAPARPQSAGPRGGAGQLHRLTARRAESSMGVAAAATVPGIRLKAGTWPRRRRANCGSSPLLPGGALLRLQGWAAAKAEGGQPAGWHAAHCRAASATVGAPGPKCAPGCRGKDLPSQGCRAAMGTRRREAGLSTGAPSSGAARGCSRGRERGKMSCTSACLCW